jgi:23S rRNA pseudouridine1911/1915/1917 synthase
MHAQRLDKVLSTLLAEFSRSYLQQLIEAGHVFQRERVAVKPSAKVLAGESLKVHLLPTEQARAFTPNADVRFDVLHQDEHLLVVNKPAGLVVHPAAGHWTDTLLNGLLYRDPLAADIPRAGIVHRLDKDTSGLMVVARSRMCMDALVKAIAGREVKREYLALATSAWRSQENTRVCELPIGRDPANRLRMAAIHRTDVPSKAAWTEVTRLASVEGHAESEGGLSFVHARLGTGRTHQIRVHMTAMGMPLVADATYGGKKALGINRQALHAFKLAFVHPHTGKTCQFEAPLPSDFSVALASLGWDTMLETARSL